jgi:tRNA(fMet)-specific endonuclease VapC
MPASSTSDPQARPASAGGSPRSALLTALCSVVVAELLFGALRSQNRTKNLAGVTRFVAGFRSFPFDDASAHRHAELRAHLAPLGTQVGPHDAMIAAIALANGLTLVTHNTREFSRIAGLRIEDWQTP